MVTLSQPQSVSDSFRTGAMGYKCYLCIISVIFIELISCLHGEKTTIMVNTTYGPIVGEEFFSSWTNKKIYAFKGIPYAAPPVGPLRFKDPVPPESWHQVKDCTQEQAICPQTFDVPPAGPVLMSEHCLYLNVYTPQMHLPGLKPLPVIVWIHGGAFIEGSGNYDLYGPDLLVAEGFGIVFVTINYRLGALGFLNMASQDAPGNVGLKDQIMALQWVKREILNFGGDPQQVTLFGESAGAVSAHLHYVSPLSSGLFHRAIADSGSSLACRVRTAEDAHQYALQLADKLGCGAKNTSEIMACLRAADPLEILRVQNFIKAPQDDKTGLTVFVPTIDKESSNAPFLTDFPYNLMKQKKSFFIPFLMGINSAEGILRLFRSEEEIKNVTNNLEYIFALQVPQDTVCPPKLKAEKINQFYFGDASKFNSGYVDLYTDVLYAYGSIINAREYQNTEKVFLYYFTFSGKFKDKFVEKKQEKYNVSGACHAEELFYLFITKGSNQTLDNNSNESTTWRRMVKMWTNFAKEGTPTVGPDPLLQNVQWLPASGGRTNHLNIDVNLTMTSEDLLAPRAALWDSISFNRCA